MKIREMSICNCLSIGPDGLNDHNSLKFGDSNLLIGANGSGKSNILKALILLGRLFGQAVNQNRFDRLPIPINPLTTFDEWFFSRDTKQVISFYYEMSIEETDTVLARMINNSPDSDNLNNPALMMLKLKTGYPKLVGIKGTIKDQDGNLEATIDSISIPNNHVNFSHHPLFDRQKMMSLVWGDAPPRNRKVWKIAEHLDEGGWQSAYKILSPLIISFFKQLISAGFDDPFVHIPDTRTILPVGDELVASLDKLRDGSTKSIAIHDHLIQRIGDLLFQRRTGNIRFVYPTVDAKPAMNIQLDQLQLPLSAYGAGVREILAIVSTILLQGSNRVVLIEEPETHLHPGLQRELLGLLKELGSILGNQYFITTHSSLFVDGLEKIEGNIFHVLSIPHGENQCEYTRVLPIDSSNTRTLLIDLGVKPSDLLFANGVVVVEGPTDEAVLVDWAEKVDLSFKDARLLTIDAEGAGNIPKYLRSDVIQQTNFQMFALCDKNAEDEIRRKLIDVVPEENILVLSKGDLEDYYPREIVMELARDLANKRNLPDPDEIKVGETVGRLTELKGNDQWKKPLAKKVIEQTEPSQIPKEISDFLVRILGAVR